MGEAAPQRRKRAKTGFTQTTFRVQAETEILWKVSHPSTIQTRWCLTSVFQWELVSQDSCTQAKVFLDITDM